MNLIYLLKLFIFGWYTIHIKHSYFVEKEGKKMARPKGTKNKPKLTDEGVFEMSLEQRMQMIADLVVERILEDQSYGRKIVDIFGIEAENAAKQ